MKKLALELITATEYNQMGIEDFRKLVEDSNPSYEDVIDTARTVSNAQGFYGNNPNYNYVTNILRDIDQEIETHVLGGVHIDAENL